MTDLHTHILPGMDDGAQSVEDALQLLRMEKQQGVDTVALTPHYYGEEETPTPAPAKKEDTIEFNPTMDVVSPFADNAKAKGFENALSGMYKSVTRVNLRKAPDTTKNNVRIVVDKGDKVRCYGYFTEVKGVKWYYVVYKGYEGYVCSTYFVKA